MTNGLIAGGIGLALWLSLGMFFMALVKSVKSVPIPDASPVDPFPLAQHAGLAERECCVVHEGDTVASFWARPISARWGFPRMPLTAPCPGSVKTTDLETSGHITLYKGEALRFVVDRSADSGWAEAWDGSGWVKGGLISHWILGRPATCEELVRLGIVPPDPSRPMPRPCGARECAGVLA
jgi:hypothetical protein